jgi:hypothetical protein
MPRHFLIAFLYLVFSGVGAAQTFTLHGTVRDASNATALPSANVRVEGTSKGTVANSLGVYHLSLEKGEHTLIFSFIGYRSDTLRISIDKPTEYNASLQPTPIQMNEVLITSEDPAVGIMRRVIEYKKRWTEALKSYEFEAFTRLVMRRDTAIAMIAESYTTGYWRKGDTLREVVKQKRKTENIPGMNAIAVGGTVVNFYDDDVFFVGFRFVGPASVEAFDYYDFKLEKTRVRDDKPIYTIRLLPRTKLSPLFKGTIDVVGDVYALVGVSISPNEAFAVPFVSKMDIKYSQQFSMYEKKYWMPMDVRLEGAFEIGLPGLTLPRIVVEQASVLYDYKINPILEDSIFTKRRVVQLPTSEKFDSLFWAQHDVLPLTHEEQKAYKTLDSTQTLDKQFQPEGPLSSLNSVMDVLKYLNIRYNRVEGPFLGFQGTRDSVVWRLSLSGAAGYGFSDRKFKFGLGISGFVDSTRRFKMGADIYRDIENIPDEGYYPSFAVMLGALLNKVDYRDYYYTEGWRTYVDWNLSRRLSTRLQYANEKHSRADKNTDFSIFEHSKKFRSNPAIDEGVLRTVSFKVHYGDPVIPLGLTVQNHIEAEFEHSARNLLASTFDFTRVIVRGEARVSTYSERLLFPPVLLLKLSAGTSWGTPPTQRLFALESSFDGVAPLGVARGAGVKEFTGRHFVLLSAEHNFRSTPFLILDIPFLYRNSIELIAHGTVAKTWSNAPMPFGTSTNGWYSEAGIGISRVFSFFRFDLTYRMMEPRGVHLTLGIAQLF